MVKLTKKQKGFVKDYLETGSGREAAIRNYNVKSPEVASVVASENLTKPNIRAAIESYAPAAAAMIEQLSQTAENENVRLGASKDILDRAGYAGVIKTQNTQVNINITPESMAVAQKYEEEIKQNL